MKSSLYDQEKLQFFSNETIGIFGAGYLGRTLAETLVEHGFPKEKLMISFGGKLSTVIFIAIKPQSLKELRNLPFAGSSLVVSCKAGISLAPLRETLDVFRVMTSGPSTIKEKKGIAAVYPQNETLTDFLTFMA